MKLLFIGALAALPFCVAHAGVSIESACYQSESSHGAAGKANAFFRFKSYRDDDAQNILGASSITRTQSQVFPLSMTMRFRLERALRGHSKEHGWRSSIERSWGSMWSMGITMEIPVVDT
jgi:hypothetical protein